MATEQLKRYKSPGTDQIPAELIKAGVGQFALISINLLILFGIRTNFLMRGRLDYCTLSIKRVIKQTVVIIEAYRFS
jgi:hypothetical protein